MSRRIACLALLFCGPLLAAVVADEPSRTNSPAVDFNRDIRPILARNCYSCHGMDDKHREAGLRLDRQEGATQKLDSGATAIVSRNLDDSELYQRLISTDDAERMPPRATGKTLSAAQIDLVKRWIEQGAPYAAHWSFVKPQRPELPVVKNTAWPRNGIDNFILARLEREGLQPSPEADRYTLIRRLSLDLRGLPPTPEEVAAFVNDTRPDAYEQLVDRLLADPAYGERWARMWLDLARYADSAGYGSDPLRTIWKYRDWVIDAFNRNVPFDQFTVEQIAGDLIERGAGREEASRGDSDVNENDERRATLIATAFHRNTKTNTEGGTDDEEFRVEAVRDRVDTTMQVWMGLTMGCGKCHDHKYEPITQREYYQFFAFFNQTADADRPDESPTISVPSPEMVKKAAEIDAKLVPLKKQLDMPTPELAEAQTKWETEVREQKDAEKAPRKGVPADVLKIIDADENRTDEQQSKLVTYYRTIAPSLKSVRDEIAKLEKAKPAFPTVPVMQELPEGKRRTTYLMEKGNFLAKGPEVMPAVPAAFHPLTSDQPRNRLGVANWLVSPDNPLTARVTVNRFWAQLFGTGFVETEEDFGAQGEPPSHPELLDWLALEFASGQQSNSPPYPRGGQGGVASPWDIKRLLKLIVTSATYRQSSRVTSELLAKDPRNRLLARGPRFRLEAELVRDQALALSGLLSRKVGGPSVYPPQPPGLWQAAFNGQRTWATSTGEDKYRRGLYTFWRRTIPYPSMATFDAPSREICSIRRIRTNTPLQAFVTLNDPVYVEAAQALARRIAKEGGDTPESRADFALQLCLARPPQLEQRMAIVELYRDELAHYKTDANAAEQMATDPLGPLPAGMDAADLAAWTIVANVLLNLDGVLTKG